MGAWSYLAPRLVTALTAAGISPRALLYRGRPAAASPATGSFRRHQQETRELVAAALAD